MIASLDFANVRMPDDREYTLHQVISASGVLKETPTTAERKDR